MKQSITKRVISMLITVSMLLTMVPSVFAANPEQFKDFPKGWSKEAMEFSVDNGLLVGKSATTIEPKSNLTRAEMATIINRAFGAKITKDISAYTDVDKSDWYYTEMQKAVNMQTFQGDGNGKLRPDDSITREEVMAVIARAMVLETDDYSSISKFKDYSSVSDWAKPYVAVLIANGYVNGYEDNTVKPQANITREEFAQLMYNIFKTYLSAKGTSYTSVYDKNCVMINNEEINLSNVTINGDLVLGDGVGTSKINLTNVTIKGRLLARGGVITLKNVTTGKGVVVKNVNGTTHFNNYRSESVFDGVVEHTYTTYLRPSYVTGGGSPSGDVTRYEVTVNYLYRDIISGLYVKDDSKTVNLRIAYGQKYTLESGAEPGFVFDKSESGIEDDATITVTGDREINLYYNILLQVSITHPSLGTGAKTADVPYGDKVGDVYKSEGLELIDKYEKDGNVYDVNWFIGDGVTENPLTSKDTAIDPENAVVTFELTAPVTIDNDNGTSLISTSVPVSATDFTLKLSDLLKDSNKPTKEGYTFKGWFDANGNEYKKDTVTKVSPLNIKAKWEANTYNLTLNTDGGTYVPGYTAPTQYKYDEELVLPTDAQLKKSGYNFGGWYDNASFNGSPVFTIPAKSTTGDKTYYAKWDWIDPGKTYYTVGFDTDGDGVADYTRQIEENTAVEKPAEIPTKEGWQFKYWSVDGVNEYNFASLVTGPMTIKALFTKIHTVTFVYGNGQPNTTEKVLDGEKVTKPADPTWTGHEFKYWTANGTDEFDFNTAISGDMTISAKWTGINTVTFKYGNGQTDKVDYVLDGEKVSKPVDPTWEDHRFDFWTVDGVNEYDFNTPVTGDIVLTAKWTKIHTVTFVYGNGQSNTTEKVIDGDKVSKPHDPTWDKHKFLFWTQNGTDAFDFDAAITDDITITAKWTGIHTVTFVYDNGQANSEEFVLTNETVTKPQDPTKADYEFKFWSLDGVNEYDFATPVTSDITLTAQWRYITPSVTTYKVTFEYGNGEPNVEKTVNKGEAVEKPADPTWDGYKFQFWTLDGVKEYDFSTAVTGDITLKAVWTKIHKVTFVYGNGQPNVEKEVLDGDLVAEPAAPTWEGHQFEFWTADGVNEFSFAKPVTGDITITAKWTGVHIVTFKYDNGDADTTQNVLDGEKAIKPADPTRENYTFEFWSRDGVNPYDFDMAVTESFTLTAIWKVVDTTVIHTVKFYAFPKGTTREKFAGELEVVSGDKLGYEDDGTISNKVKTVYREQQGSESRYELWDFANPTGAANMVVKGYYDAAESFQHYIRPDLVYNKNGKWESFTGDTVVTKDMEVYAVRRRVELYLEGSILGISLPSFGATLKTPYNSATRAVDSLKDALWISRDSFELVFTDDFQGKIYAKLAPKSKGLIDSNGYILNKEFSMKIADVISVSELEKEIRNYITRILEEGTEDEIRELIEIVHIETFIDYIGIVKLAELVGYDVVRDAVMSADNRDTLIKYIQDELASESNDFRDILLGNTEFLEAALASAAIKDAVIDAIITKPDILINVLSVGNNRETFIDIAVNQPAFINALLTNEVFEAKIIDLVHHNDEDKAAFKALIEEDDKVRNQIFDEALTHDEVVYYLEHDVTFLKHVVDILNNSASESVKANDYKNIMDAISSSAEFKEKVETIVGYTLNDTDYMDVVNDYQYEVSDDTTNGKITKEIAAILTAYDASATTGIDKLITDYVVSVIDSYIANGTCDFDSHIEELIIDFVSDYLDEKIADETVEKVIDDVVLNYIEQYMNYTDSDWDAIGDDDLKDFVVTIKDDFIDYAKTTEMTDNYKKVIRTFVTKEDNNSVIISLFNTYYDTMKSYIVENAADTTVNPELHKIIKAQALADNIYNILSTFIAENENYIRTTVLADGELEKYINKYANDSTFKTFVTDHVDLDTVIDFVMDIRVKEAGEEDEPDLDSFITEAIDMLKGLDYYKNFIKCFQNKDATYHVDKSDIHFALAVGEAVHGYTFDEALELLGGGPIYDIINKIGKDKFESIYNESRDDFNNGIKGIYDKIYGNDEEGIVADENYSEEYEMSLKMKINFAELIDEYYTKLHDKVTAKVESVAPYYYTENQYLREFVDGITVDNYLDFDASAKSEVNSGYKFKPLMEYYDLMYENLLLIDKAVLWYGPNTPEEFVNLRDDIANDIIKGFDKLQSILENLDEDGKIFGSYTIKDVIARVDSLKKLGDKVPQLNTVIDNVCKILSKVEGGEVIAKGYTLDDLVELSERLDSAVATLRDEEYEKLNSELESLVDKTIEKIDEILDELDADGTILGKVSIDDLASKVNAIDKIYKKFESKIDSAIGKLADIEKGSVSGKFDTEYWEDILFGEDDYNRFDLDDIFDVACPKLDKFRVDEPYTDNNKRLVIDELKVKGGGATVTFDRYLD